VIELARLVDAAAGGGVLVFGSPPPDGRDLDLLVRRPQEDTIASRLTTEGLSRRGVQWAAFRNCTAVGVDLIPAADWKLPPAELAALFEEAAAVPGFRHLVAPAPHHALLIAARRVARAGSCDARLRSRIAASLRDAPSAWRDAEQRAPAWNAVEDLALLRELYEEGTAPGNMARARAIANRMLSSSGRQRRRAAARTLRRLTGRPAIVALSGLDGAGKSFQAVRLQSALERLGYRAVVVWPAASNVIYQANPALKRRLRAILDRLGSRGEGERAKAPAPAAGEPWVEPMPRQSAPLTHVLAALVALAQAWSFRRGSARAERRIDVVIYDRYVLDSIVYLRQRWGDGRALPLQSTLIRRLARRPSRAFLLDLPPEVAYARKQDYPVDNLRERATLYHQLYPALGVRRLDGQRSREELCAEIAREVWEALD